MLSDERIDEIAKPFAGFGGVEQYREFANAIEHESTAPLIEQIKEDEALMRDVLTVLNVYPRLSRVAAAIRQRMEAKT